MTMAISRVSSPLSTITAAINIPKEARGLFHTTLSGRHRGDSLRDRMGDSPIQNQNDSMDERITRDIPKASRRFQSV